MTKLYEITTEGTEYFGTNGASVFVNDYFDTDGDIQLFCESPHDIITGTSVFLNKGQVETLVTKLQRALSK